MAQYFMIIHRPGPAWIEGESFQNQKLFDHGQYIHSLHEKGQLLEGGPFTDSTGGMAIIKVEDAAQAEEIVKQDPAIRSGVFTAEMHPWMRVDWENFG